MILFDISLKIYEVQFVAAVLEKVQGLGDKKICMMNMKYRSQYASSFSWDCLEYIF